MSTVEVTVAILVALIGAVIPASIAAYVQVHRLRRENNEQHGENARRLDASHHLLTTIHLDVKDVREDVKQVRTDLDRHLGEHDAQSTFRRAK